MHNKGLIYTSAALIIFILSFAKFTDIAPLSVGFTIALCALGLNAPVLSVFLLTSGAYYFSAINFVYLATACVILNVLWLVGRKRKPKGYWYICGALAAQLGLVAGGLAFDYNAVALTVSAFFALVYAYLCYCFGVPLIKNGLRYKLLDSELISGGIILASLAYGLNQLPLPFPVSAAFFAVAVLTSCKIFGAGGVSVGICFALGYAIKGGTELVGAFALMSLTALIFIPAPRILSALSLVMSFVMYTFFFNVIPSNGWMWAVSLLAGGIVYMLLPAGKLDKMREFFMPDGRKVLRSMVNRSRVAAGVKLDAVSGVFGEMSSIMSSGQGEVSEGHLVELTDSLIGGVCSLCNKYDMCLKNAVIPSVGKVMEAALHSGRPSVAELPDKIKSNCVSIAALISTSSELASDYTEKVDKLKRTDSAKKMVSSQLKGISDILAALAKKEAEPLRFDADVEKKIAEELTYRYVVTSEALVSADGSFVMLAVLTDTINNEVIASVLKKLLGRSYAVEKCENGSLSGRSVVYVTAKPKYDVVFSVCGCPKEGEHSGDTHSFIKIDSHRFLMAVCDGMGSGERANRFSTSTITLIEDFYKAGFSHKLVLESVNNFLTLSSEEIYSAVDIAVVDLIDGSLDIIKIGSPPSFIKTKDSVLRVEGAALPIGLLEEMKPTIVSYSLKGGETVVFTSDGASVFGGNGLCDLINNSSKLPEELCKSVVGEVLSQSGKPADDITVAAFHIFEAA